MKKMLFSLMVSILAAATSFGATNWSKSVQMDQNYVLLNRSQIVLSNLLAIAAGDLLGTTNNSTVIGLQGKSIPAPSAGDGGKVYAYNSGTGAFELVSLGSVAYAVEAGHATNANYSLSSLYSTNAGYATTAGSATNETLSSVTARGSNTPYNVTLVGEWTRIGSVGTTTWDTPIYELHLGRNLGYREDIWNDGSIIAGEIVLGTQHMEYCRGSLMGGHLGLYGSGAALQFMNNVYGGLSWGCLDEDDWQENQNNYGGWAVGKNNLVVHDFAYCFGDGVSSIETNAFHTRKYYATQAYMPATSNTVDLGSLALPFRDLYLGSNSIYMAGTKALSYSNGYLVAQIPLADSSGVAYVDSNTVSGVSGRVGSLEGRSNDWNTASSWVGANSNVVGTIQAVSNYFNSASVTPMVTPTSGSNYIDMTINSQPIWANGTITNWLPGNEVCSTNSSWTKYVEFDVGVNSCTITSSISVVFGNGFAITNSGTTPVMFFKPWHQTWWKATSL